MRSIAKWTTWVPRGGIVELPAGRFAIRSLTLRDSVAIVGRGRGATTLVSLNDGADGLVQLAAGPVRFAGLKSLTLDGGRPMSGTAPQWAINLVSAPSQTGKAHGGLWRSSFSDISIEGFGRGINLSGSDGNYLLPHQFITFQDTNVTLISDASGPALSMIGQVNQCLFEKCYFDSRTYAQTPMIQMKRGTMGANSPKLHEFRLTTIQNSSIGVEIFGAENIGFERCWFENLGKAIIVGDKSQGIDISDNRFANAGSTGNVVTFEHDCSGSVSGNIYAGSRSVSGLQIDKGANVETSR